MSIATSRLPTRSSVRATASWLLGMNLFLAAWFWGMVILVVTAALVVISLVGEVNNSILAFARQAAVWFPFSVLIAIMAAYLPVHVAAGLTRRSLPSGRCSPRRGRPSSTRSCSAACCSSSGRSSGRSGGSGGSSTTSP
jgi:hypothetical protein